jgi:hypothetical protein
MRLGQQTANLDQVMERVLSRVKIVEEALAIQTKELSAASDGAVAKLRTVESMVKKQADTVGEAADRVENRLQASADEFNVRSRIVTEKFERATADLEKASTVAIGRAEAMGQISDTVIQKIDTVGARVREHAEQLANSATRASVQADNIRDTLAPPERRSGNGGQYADHPRQAQRNRARPAGAPDGLDLRAGPVARPFDVGRSQSKFLGTHAAFGARDEGTRVHPRVPRGHLAEGLRHRVSLGRQDQGRQPRNRLGSLGPVVGRKQRFEGPAVGPQPAGHREGLLALRVRCGGRRA